MKMRRTARSILAVPLFATAAQAFTLTGTVHERGTVVPLSGATATIANRPEISAAHSDAQGAFLLTDQSTDIAEATSPMSVRWEAGTLVVRGAGQGLVQLDVLTLSGRRVASIRKEASNGEARFPVDGIGQGVRVLRLRQGAVSRQWTLAALPRSGSILLSGGMVAARSTAGTGVDTLVVAKPGMETQKVVLPQGAGDAVTALASPVDLAPTMVGRMRYVPEGRVRMGDSLFAESSPCIWRTVQAFWMDTVPASVDDLKALGFAQSFSDGRPAELDWTAAVRYCNARSLAEHLPPAYDLTADSAFWTVKPGATGYRLPSEAEWEYAVRAGTTSPWFWGDDSTKAGEYAQYTLSTAGNPRAGGLLKPNGFGLYDIVGNTWEWTEDFFGPYVADETQPVARKQAYGYHRVYRGGAWYSDATALRSGYRNHDLILATGYIGVRCVRTAVPVVALAPEWSTLPVSGEQRRIPGGTVRMGDSTQPEALPFNTRKVKDLWVDTALVLAAEVNELTGATVYGDSTKPADLQWYLAVRYCNARSRRDNLDSVYSLAGDSTTWKADTAKDGYRLPTEAEWEYLARAGSATGWSWGNDTSVNTLAPRAWWAGNSVGNVQPPALKLPNAFGLYDMAGDSWQWTEDLYGPYAADGSQPVPEQEAYGVHRVYRGGAWYAAAEWLRPGRRKHDMGLASGYIGFRCVRTAK